MHVTQMHLFYKITANTKISTLSLHDALPIFGGGQKAASGGIQGDVLATDNNTVGMGDAGIKSAIQGSNVIGSKHITLNATEIGRAVQQECRDRSRMPSSA